MKTNNLFSATFRVALTFAFALLIFTACQEESINEPAIDEVAADIVVGLTAEEAKTLGLTPEEAKEYSYTEADLAELTGQEDADGRWFRNVIVQTSPLQELTNGGLGLGDTIGFSKIVRMPRGVLSLVFSTDQEIGTATTLWVAVYNTPEACADGLCTTPEAFNPATGADVKTGTGKVIKGPVTVYTTFTEANDTEGSLGPILLGQPARGITNPLTCQMRLIVKTHGPVIPELLNDQLTTFQGGCKFGFLPQVPELGTPGPNTCAEIQISFFMQP